MNPNKTYILELNSKELAIVKMLVNATYRHCVNNQSLDKEKFKNVNSLYDKVMDKGIDCFLDNVKDLIKH